MGIFITHLSFAQTVQVNFKGGGQTVFDGWVDINSSNYSPMFYGFYSGLSEWTRPMLPNVPNSFGSSFVKISNGVNGGAYPASESLYFGGFSAIPNTLGGTMGVDGKVLSDTKTIIFQIEIGNAFDINFHQPSGKPRLLINDDILIEPSYVTIINRYEDPNGTDTNPLGEPVFINTYAYQWNIGQTVLSFTINFSAVEHCQVYEMRLDQTTELQTQNVLAPSLKILNLGVPVFNGTETIVTYQFQSDPDKILNMEYTNDLYLTWESMGYQNTTNDGIFNVIVKKAGNHVNLWKSKMFFRIRLDR